MSITPDCLMSSSTVFPFVLSLFQISRHTPQLKITAWCHMSFVTACPTLLAISCLPFSTHSALTGTPATAGQTFSGGGTSCLCTTPSLSSKCHLGLTILGTSPLRLATLVLVDTSVSSSSTCPSWNPYLTTSVTTLMSWSSCLLW